MTVDNFLEIEGLENIDIQQDQVDPYISWSRCDCCGSNKTADRYDCHGYNPTTKKVQGGYSICPDCLYEGGY